jgi:hypothetical protein
VDAGLESGSLNLAGLPDHLRGAVEHIAESAEGQPDAGDLGVSSARPDASALPQGVQEAIQFTVVRA